jgi:ABC-type transport system involved in cytochrome c biogenesis ATPase subunit
VPGEANLWPGLTGSETLHLLGRVQGKVDSAYQVELIERFQLDASKRVRAYSKGNRQKVLLVAALSSRAELLILDEPTTGLDPLMEQTFRECVGEARERGQAVFLSSHMPGLRSPWRGGATSAPACSRAPRRRTRTFGCWTDPARWSPDSSGGSRSPGSRG